MRKIIPFTLLLTGCSSPLERAVFQSAKGIKLERIEGSECRPELATLQAPIWGMAKVIYICDQGILYRAEPLP